MTPAGPVVILSPLEFIKLDEMWQAFRPNGQNLSHWGRYSEASSVMLWIMSQL